MHHITLDTGHVRWSPRSEVGNDLMRVLVDHLHTALREAAPLPGAPDLTARAVADPSGALAATVSKRLRDATAPLLTIVVVPEGGDILHAVAAMRQRVTPADTWVETRGPWCLVTLYPTMAFATADEIAILGDYERCVAWAWLDSGAATVRPQ